MNVGRSVFAFFALTGAVLAVTSCGNSETVTVPYVEVADPTTAYELLHEAGLLVSTSETLSYKLTLYAPSGYQCRGCGFTGRPRAHVVSQTPRPGSTVARGSVVEITVDGRILQSELYTGMVDIERGGEFDCDSYPADSPDLLGENLGSLNRSARCFSLAVDSLPPLDAAGAPTLLDNYVVTWQSPAPGAPILPLSASNPGGTFTLKLKVAASD